MRVLEKNGCLLRERTSVSERHRAHPPRRRQLPRRLHVANWSEYRSPATCDWLSRPEAATKVRRRKLALLVESEFKASDMILRVPAPRRRPEAQGHRRVPRHASAPLMREKGPVSRWAAPQGSAPPHRAGRHRRPPRPGGQGLPPPRPPGSNGSGTSPTSARGSDSCIWPLFWTAATRESRRLRHGRQHEDRPDLQGHRYGRAPLPPPGGGHDLPLRPGQSVHLTAIRQTSEELQDPPLRRENRRVLGQCLGASPSTPPRENERAHARGAPPHGKRPSKMLPRGSN